MRIFACHLKRSCEIDAAVTNDAGAEILNLLALNGIRLLWQKNGGRYSKCSSGEGRGGAVISRAGSDHLVDLAALQILGEGIHCSARLERTGWQHGFDFEINFRARTAQARCFYQRSRRKRFREQLLRLTNARKLSQLGDDNTAVLQDALR